MPLYLVGFNLLRLKFPLFTGIGCHVTACCTSLAHAILNSSGLLESTCNLDGRNSSIVFYCIIFT